MRDLDEWPLRGSDLPNRTRLIGRQEYFLAKLFHAEVALAVT